MPFDFSSIFVVGISREGDTKDLNMNIKRLRHCCKNNRILTWLAFECKGNIFFSKAKCDPLLNVEQRHQRLICKSSKIKPLTNKSIACSGKSCAFVVLQTLGIDRSSRLLSLYRTYSLSLSIVSLAFPIAAFALLPGSLPFLVLPGQALCRLPFLSSLLHSFLSIPTLVSSHCSCSLLLITVV